MAEELDSGRTTKQWYVVHCASRKEHLAGYSLHELLGLTVYIPEVQYTYQGKRQLAPFFPRYLFVHVDLREVSGYAINAMPGVARLVSFGDVPQPVPTQVIRDIYEGLERLNADGGLPAHTFQPGDTVQLKGGPFRGLEAVFQGPLHPSERVRVLIDFLGSLREVEMHVDMLTGTNTGYVQRRRTRGKGRRIRPADPSLEPR